MTLDAPAKPHVPFLDINAEGFSVRSPEVLAARDAHWYANTNLGVAILRYEEASALLKDKRLIQGSAKWPAHNGVTSGPVADWWGDMLLNQEGEDHARLRRLANPAFSPRILEALVPDFIALANELVDEFSAAGECEFMADFAEPYAARVITRLLGMREEQWREVAELSTTFGLAFSVQIAEELPQITAALDGLNAIAAQLIEQKRESNDDDFLSTLVQAGDSGEHLSQRELMNMVGLMIFGGFDTTRNQLGLAMKTFIDHPDQWELLRNDPELAKNAVEEVMRVNPTVTWVTREAAEDFSFKDLEVPAGTTIHLFSVPACSDPNRFEVPEFNIASKNPPHFGFGGGIHHCIGHFVARIDMREALKTLSARMPNPRLGEGATFLPDSGNTGPMNLPVHFDPTPRIGA